jgi:D-methionine transport system substrate-binding protein
MKKTLYLLTLILAVSLAFAGCSTEEKKVNETDLSHLKIGATPVPHAELLALIGEDLANQGITLEIVEFTDYVKPNLALSDGEIDANFFQHSPYLESFAEDHKLDLQAVATIHVEPLGLYAHDLKNIDDLKEGSTIAIPSDAVNGGRALILLQAEGLITLKEGYSLEATELDIVDNPKSLKFKAIESAQLPRILPDVDGAVINGNFALEAGLVPTRDALLLEGSDSPYANIIATRSDNADDEKIQKLIEVLQSEKVKSYILEHYNGGVVPTF